MSSDPTTIVYVSDATNVGGAELVLLSYLDRLREPAFRTHVFLRASNVRLLEQLERRGIEHTISTYFSRRIIRTTLHPVDLWHFAASFRKVRGELLDLSRRLRPHVLHSISYPASLYVAFAAPACGVPHLWHEHNVKRIHRFNRPIYRFVAGTCDYVIGPSNAVTRTLATAGLDSRRLRTVYNGVDLARFRPRPNARAELRAALGLAADEPAIGLVGQLLPHKGHVTLIEAAPRIRAAFPHARFFVVGLLDHPSYEAELRQKIDEAGLAAAFTFTGWRSDVPDVMAALDIPVVPTLTPEPAALGLMEAMAVARPVVASRTGGTPELVIDGHTGLLFPPGDADALAQCVVELLGHPDTAKRLGLEGRRRMEGRFGLERHIAEVVHLYDQCRDSNER